MHVAQYVVSKESPKEFAMAEQRTHEEMVDLLHHDHYSCEELASLLDIDVHYLQHEALTGHLKAIIIDHHIVSIRRDAVVDWLRERQGVYG
jgi:hypothetical protein